MIEVNQVKREIWQKTLEITSEENVVMETFGVRCFSFFYNHLNFGQGGNPVSLPLSSPHCHLLGDWHLYDFSTQ